MQATGTLREAGLSRGFILVVVALLCALALGAAGGYAARGASQAGNGAPAHAQRVVDANQGGPDADLTRAMPSVERPQPAQPAQPDSGLIP